MGAQIEWDLVKCLKDLEWKRGWSNMDSNRDLKERLDFVRFWANYMKTHSNSVWSRQQVMLINSVLKTADRDPKLYLR